MTQCQERPALILVAYNPIKTLHALTFARRLDLAYPNLTKILVLNHPSLALNQEIRRQALGWSILSGTNDQHEISGWQEGLNHLIAYKGKQIPVLFLNDTVVSHRYFSIFRLIALIWSINQATNEQLIGFIDWTPRGMLYSINGLILPGWVSTYCFFLTPEALAKLKYTIWDKHQLEISVIGGPDTSKFFGKNVSLDLQRHLCRWLFVQGWYAAAPLCAENHDQMVLKAKSIIAEQWLTARCLAAGIKIIDPFDKLTLLRKADYRMVKYRGILKRWLRSN